ncbi:hypothetical protein [Serratia sp. 201]|uniref:hypothetical protein n=1 Tax=Serratia sp. 201 TaxID=3096764 RepID=UPI003007FFB2
MFKYLMLIILFLSNFSLAEINYKITKAEIKPYTSDSFGSGYMGLQEKPNEPGYGLFYDIKLSSNDDAEIWRFLSDKNSSINTMTCNNKAIKSLLDGLYTINMTFYKENGDVIIGLLTNKNSCNR